MRISDWSSDVCSSDLIPVVEVRALADRRTAGVFEEVLRLHNRAGRGILQNATVGVLAKLEELELLLGKARQSLHGKAVRRGACVEVAIGDRKSTRLNSSH